MNEKSKSEITNTLRAIWHDICVLERDYLVEYTGYMTQILKFTMQCIADKYKIDLGLRKDEEEK